MPNQAEETLVAMGACMDAGGRPTIVPAHTAADPELFRRPVRCTFTAAGGCPPHLPESYQVARSQPALARPSLSS